MLSSTRLEEKRGRGAQSLRGVLPCSTQGIALPGVPELVIVTARNTWHVTVPGMVLEVTIIYIH